MLRINSVLQSLVLAHHCLLAPHCLLAHHCSANLLLHYNAVLADLLATHRYTLAAGLVAAHQTGQQPESATLDSIFTALCDQCLRLEVDPTHPAAWLEHNDTELILAALPADVAGTGLARDAAIPNAGHRAWALLQALLLRYDTTATGFRVRHVALVC